MTEWSAQITVFTGPFGSGKTEVALNHAVRLSERGQHPYLVDLDIVTPYFRVRDVADGLERRGVRVVTPHPVAQRLDLPAISPQIRGAMEQRHDPVVVDLGGDTQGSRALAQYTALLRDREHSVLFVVNPYRPFMDTTPRIERAVRAIEASALVRVSCLVSNPNLMSESSLAVFRQGHEVVVRASRAMGLPLAFAVAEETLSEQVRKDGLGVDLMVLHRFFRVSDPGQG